MRAMSFTACHYGAEYLEYALRSVAPFVEECLVAYTPSPSFGKGTTLVCPDSQEAIFAAAKRGAGDKLATLTSRWGSEAEHRATGTEYAKRHGFDVVVVVDSDEVWIPGRLAEALTMLSGDVSDRPREWGVVMRHLWQSFEAVCDDRFAPIRIIDLGGDSTIGGTLPDPASVYHFGYAISDELMSYKWSGLHGHQDEMRPGWLEEKWLARATDDVHPVVHGLWTAQPFDPSGLPEIMRAHPRYPR